MPESPSVGAVLIDIEGTVAPIAYVHEVLFPYAADRLDAFCAGHPDSPELEEVRRLAPDRQPIETLRRWMARDEKITVLKTIQGTIWQEGYASGALTAELYPDVAPALRRWRAAGIRLAVYSSGSVAAQTLLFRHSDAGDLTPLFDAFHDTTTGPKRDPGSYAAIAGADAGRWLFLSDVTAELDAAAAAGLRTCQIVRPRDGTVPGPDHPLAADLDEVGRLFHLP